MSSASTTSHKRLSADLPGTITTSFFEVANAVDFFDKSRLPLWFTVSWHSRQWWESNGAISRSKNCSFGEWLRVASCVPAERAFTPALKWCATSPADKSRL